MITEEYKNGLKYSLTMLPDAIKLAIGTDYPELAGYWEGLVASIEAEMNYSIKCELEQDAPDPSIPDNN